MEDRAFCRDNCVNQLNALGQASFRVPDNSSWFPKQRVMKWERLGSLFTFDNGHAKHGYHSELNWHELYCLMGLRLYWFQKGTCKYSFNQVAFLWRSIKPVFKNRLYLCRFNHPNKQIG